MTEENKLSHYSIRELQDAIDMLRRARIFDAGWPARRDKAIQKMVTEITSRPCKEVYEALTGEKL